MKDLRATIRVERIRRLDATSVQAVVPLTEAHVRPSRDPTRARSTIRACPHPLAPKAHATQAPASLSRLIATERGWKWRSEARCLDSGIETFRLAIRCRPAAPSFANPQPGPNKTPVSIRRSARGRLDTDAQWASVSGHTNSAGVSSRRCPSRRCAVTPLASPSLRHSHGLGLLAALASSPPDTGVLVLWRWHLQRLPAWLSSVQDCQVSEPVICSVILSPPCSAPTAPPTVHPGDCDCHVYNRLRNRPAIHPLPRRSLTVAVRGKD